METVILEYLFDVEEWVNRVLPADATWHEQNHHRRELDEFEAAGVPWNGANIVGHSLTGAESAALCRALQDLERRGLVECYRPNGRRTTHAKLSDAGRNEARRIKQVSCSPDTRGMAEIGTDK